MASPTLRVQLATGLERQALVGDVADQAVLEPDPPARVDGEEVTEPAQRLQ